MIQESGPKDWSTYTWYQVGTDLGAGASAMIYDADILGYFMNGGDNKMKPASCAYAAFTANPEAKASTPNIWIWSLAMSNFSKDKDATWYFMQWASGLEHAIFGATKMDFVNPVRQSVWKDEAFRDGSTRAIRAMSTCSTRRLPARRSSSRRSRCSST
jgi:multiple sugar transport system substrate-binding protein